MFKEFKFSHKNIKNINIPMELVIENYRDFEHVSYVHKRCFKYSNMRIFNIKRKPVRENNSNNR